MTGEPEQLAVLAGLVPFLPADPFRSQRFSGPTFGELAIQPQWRRGLLLVLADALTARGARWLHVSFSRRDRVPDHSEVTQVRRAVFRPGSVVVQVFPPADEYVNIHPHCLHLWERLDGERLVPDLRGIDPLLPGLGMAV